MFLYGWFEWALAWGVFAPVFLIIWGLMLDAFYNKRGYMHAILISVVLFLIGAVQTIGWKVIPIDYYLLFGVITAIIVIFVAILLVKISTRSMEKATS